MNVKRCAWANTHPLFIPYHDQEWGVPVHDDRLLFEMLNLEGAQAGLSWLTILQKRANYQKAFSKFEIEKVVRLTPKQLAKLKTDPGLVRHPGKLAAVVANAHAARDVQKEFGSLDKYFWSFVDGAPLTRRKRARALKVADALSRDLKRRGFRFVGPTTCFAFMQAVGLIDDHAPGCAFRRQT